MPNTLCATLNYRGKKKRITLLLWRTCVGSCCDRRCSNPFGFPFLRTVCFLNGFLLKFNEMALNADGNKNPLRRRREDGEDNDNAGVKRDRTEASRY